MKTRIVCPSKPLICAAALLTLAAVQDAFGAAYVVTTISDSGSGSLRQSLLDANALGGGTITFSATGTISLLSPLPDITTNVTIAGPGTNSLTVSGNGANRVFTISSNITVAIHDLTMASGASVGTNGGPGLASGGYGGAVLNKGAGLSITNCMFTGNVARGGDGSDDTY